MNPDDLKRYFPNASASTIKANLNQAGDKRLRPEHPQPDEGHALDPLSQGEETRWYDADDSFEIVFTVYSVRPADYDGYDIKHLQDWLVTAGILPGDGWETLSGRVVSRKAATEGEERTVITITRYSPAATASSMSS